MAIAFNLANGDVIQITVVTRFDDQSAENVLHYRVTLVPPSVFTLAQALQGFSINMETELKLMLTSNTRFEGLLGRIVDPPNRTTPSIVDTSDAGIGTIIGLVLPRQVAGMITKLGRLPGPAGRGRMYTPFPPHGAQNADTSVTAAYQTLMTNLANQLFNTMVLTAGANSVTLAPCIFRSGDAPVTQDISDFIVRSKFATMRKRGSYGQPNRPL